MMKLVFVAALVAVAVADVSHLVRPLQARTYQPVVAHNGQQVAILRQENEISPEGSYQWAYETENGIAAQEQGSVKAQGPEQAIKSAQGSYSYTSPEGEQVQIQYVADENGFQPTGTHIPQAPAIPAAILRSLEYIAAHPQPQYQPQEPQYTQPKYQQRF